MEEGLPYQSLVSSVLHKYVSGGLKDISANKTLKQTSRRMHRDWNLSAFGPLSGWKNILQLFNHTRSGSKVRQWYLGCFW
jgi:hypothetical protein